MCEIICIEKMTKIRTIYINYLLYCLAIYKIPIIYHVKDILFLNFQVSTTVCIVVYNVL